MKLGSRLVVLLVMTLMGSTLSAQNLLQNGDFESWTGGSPDYWMMDQGINVDQESGTVHGGSYSAKVTLLTQTQSNADFQHDTVEIQPSQMYTLSAWVFDNDSAGRARLLIRWYDSNGQYISSYYGPDYSVDQDSWQELSMEALAPQNAGMCVAGLRFYDDSAHWDGDAVFYVDDISLEVSSQGPETLTIHEIQGEADSSPHVGEVVVTRGIVTAVYPYSSVKGFFLQERPEGPWTGIFVYTGSEPTVSQGDSIWITAEVSEYYGLTELKNITDILVITGPVELPEPIVLSTGEAGQEMYEGVLIKVDSAVCTNADLGYGEWEVDDGTGPLRIDDLGVSYTPVEGHPYRLVGPLYFSYGDFKMEPRDSADILDLTGIEENWSYSRDGVRLSGLNMVLSLRGSGLCSIKLYRPDGRLADLVFNGYLNNGTYTFDLEKVLSSLPKGVYYWKVVGAVEGKGKVLWLK